MAAIEGVQNSFVRAIVAERSYCVFVAATFDLVFDKEESGPKVMGCFPRLLPYVRKIAYVWMGGWI